MDRLVDHLFVFEGEGEIRDYPGNYSQYRQWQALQNANKDEPDSNAKVAEKTMPVTESTPISKTRQLTYKEKREFDQLEKEIRSLTEEKAIITQQLSNGDLPFEELQQLSNRIGEVTAQLDEKELRWLELSELL